MVKRIVRILGVVIVIVTISAALVRQPVLTSLPYRSTFHADPHALETHVRFLADNRRAGAPEYIANEFRLAGGVVTEQAFLMRKQTFHNVIATFGPNDPNAPVIVVGAHYDAFNDLPAADDNASGTAGLLELARLLGTAKLSRPITLVAYPNEEPPFFASENMGSAVHAASIAQRNVEAMICLEMIGYFGHEQMWRSWVLSLLYPNDGNFIAVAGGWNDRQLARTVKRAILGAHEVDVLSFTGPHEMLDASDQRNYWSRGWRAVMVTDTAYVRNPNYHTIHDTPDTLDYKRMAGVVDGVFSAVTHIALL
jgi:Zn-dependent M28 family amino/carboxypeptidase